jgi:proteasome assembly chaperone (PAC2) family protein
VDAQSAATRVLEDLAGQQLRQPRVVAGFGGWINAGSASTAAIEHLITEFTAHKVAELDPERFYQLSDVRPTTALDADGQRIHVWPRAEVSVARLEQGERDLILFLGPEPNLRWREFTTALVDIFQALGATTLFSLGAILAPVHYRAAVEMRGWGTNFAFRAALRQRRISMSRYEGPTGITTVLHAAAHARGLPGAGLTASTPSYLPGMAHPWTAAALLRVVAELSGVPIDLEALDSAAAALAEQIDDFLMQRPSLRARIDALRQDEPPERPPQPPSESRSNEPGGGLPSPEGLVRDLEEFLRQLRGGGDPGTEGG